MGNRSSLVAALLPLLGLLVQGCSSTGRSASSDSSDAGALTAATQEHDTDDAGAGSDVGGDTPSVVPVDSCGLTAQQMDDGRTCAVGSHPVPGLCAHSPQPVTKSSIIVCAVDPGGVMYRVFIASNANVTETPGWTYATQSRTTPSWMPSATAPLSASDLMACASLGFGLVEPCANDAGTD